MILGDDRSLFDITFNIMEFFKHESCGKCVPCRVGTSLLVEMMKETRPKENRKELLKRMFEEADFMAKSSLCPLGQSPILSISSIRHFFKDQF